MGDGCLRSSQVEVQGLSVPIKPLGPRRPHLKEMEPQVPSPYFYNRQSQLDSAWGAGPSSLAPFRWELRRQPSPGRLPSHPRPFFCVPKRKGKKTAPEGRPPEIFCESACPSGHPKYSLHTTWQFGLAKLVETPGRLTVRKCCEASLALRRANN